MPRKKEPKTKLVHHFDFAKYTLQIEVMLNDTQGANLLIKEGDDLSELKVMGNALADALPDNFFVHIYEDRSSHAPIWQRCGTQEPSKPRNHTYEIVEVDD